MSALVWTLPHAPRGRRLGAAELKAASRQFLTRALLIAACAHLMSIAGARVLSGWLARSAGMPPVDIVSTEFLHRTAPVPVPIREPTRPAATRAAEDGLPRVTADEAAPVEQGDPNAKVFDDAPPGPPGTASVEDVPAPAVEAPPRPTDFVVFDEEPVLVWMPKPVYPEIARLGGLEGSVVVLALIGRHGEVQEVEIDRGKGSPLFDDAALTAVRASTWKPALNGNTPVMVWVKIPIHFRLN